MSVLMKEADRPWCALMIRVLFAGNCHVKFLILLYLSNETLKTISFFYVR